MTALPGDWHPRDDFDDEDDPDDWMTACGFMPGEGASPARTPRTSVDLLRIRSAYRRARSPIVPARGSLRTFGPCLTTGEA